MRFVFLVVLFFSLEALSASVIHEVLEDETAWFLSELYYGSGKQFPKILKANRLQRPEEIKPGIKLKIVGARYSPANSDFSGRRQRLWLKRQKALGLARPDDTQGVYLPTDEIRRRDKTK